MTPSELRNRAKERLKKAILEEAAKLLASKGPAALTMRKIAEKVGASTMVIYSHFGNKRGIIIELYLEGYRRLGGILKQVPENEDPISYLLEMATAFWDFAFANPHFYQVMFGNPFPDIMPSEADRIQGLGESNIELLRSRIAQGYEKDYFRNYDPIDLVSLLWSASHGMISLEMAGLLVGRGISREKFRKNLETILNGLLNNR